MLHRLTVVGQITAKSLFTPAVELLRAFFAHDIELDCYDPPANRFV